MDIDRIDARLLAAVQRNNRTSTEALGQTVGLSSTAVQRRLKRLRKSGLIEADVSIVSPKILGENVCMIVLVALERARPDIIDQFKQAIRRTPEVMSGFDVTGDADFVLVITTQDMQQYETFTRKFFQNHGVKWHQTMVVVDRVKASFALPIDVERYQVTAQDNARLD